MTDGYSKWLLCGGLASGKSAVRAIMDSQGLVTIDSDAIGREVLEPGGGAYEAVRSEFPSVVVNDHIDRALLAEIVFHDRNMLAVLEGITHPYIFGTIGQRVEQIEGEVVVEVPLLQDLGGEWCRIVVDAEDDIRLARAIERGMSGDDARSRMDSQPTRAEWLAAADIVIPNHGDTEELKQSVHGLMSLIVPD